MIGFCPVPRQEFRDAVDGVFRNWNSNESVGTAAAEILAAWNTRFGGGDLPPSKSGPEVRRAWLGGFTSTKRANIAAPALTLHGYSQRRFLET